MARDDTAYAANWRTVLLVDAAVGAVAAAVGMALLFKIPALGGLLVAGGLVYVVAVVRRARHWARLRREAGL
ncbi:MAG TPA: hypothetical protein VFA83_14120 [Acidimicrobiales bacterium]|nr:hypothetical protein [Acidimicrobiales bacterium]